MKLREELLAEARRFSGRILRPGPSFLCSYLDIVEAFPAEISTLHAPYNDTGPARYHVYHNYPGALRALENHEKET